MASHQGKLKQYLIIIESLKKFRTAKYEQIQDILSQQGFDISKRTFQRNLDALRNEFGVEIVCHLNDYTYSIDEEASFNTEILVHFLSSVVQTDLIMENLKNVKDSSKYIYFADKSIVQGTELIPQLLRAIYKQQVLTFDHQSYAHNTTSSYKVEPALLCEYLNRWYLVGYVPKRDQYRTFGLDRISQLSISKETFIAHKEDRRGVFDHLIGVNYSGLTPHIERVEIKVTPKQSLYLRSKPLHASQNERAENYFEYDLIVNKELIQRFMMMGAEVEVLKPNILRQTIKNKVEEMYKMYQ